MRLRVASYESCRASRCTQATYESTLSPTHLMQQLLAFVHPLLKLAIPYHSDGFARRVREARALKRARSSTRGARTRPPRRAWRPVPGHAERGRRVLISPRWGVGVALLWKDKWNPGKWKHGPKLAVPWWFNFNPYPDGARDGARVEASQGLHRGK